MRTKTTPDEKNEETNKTKKQKSNAWRGYPKITSLQPVNHKKTPKATEIKTENTLKKKEILKRLANICEQLENWAKSSKPVLPIRINLMKAAIYGYSTILSAIRFQDIDERLDNIEKQLSKKQEEIDLIKARGYKTWKTAVAE